MTGFGVCFDCDAPIGLSRAAYVDNGDGTRTWFHARCASPWLKRQGFKPTRVPQIHYLDPIATAAAALGFGSVPELEEPAPTPEPDGPAQLALIDGPPPQRRPPSREPAERALGRKQRRFGR